MKQIKITSPGLAQMTRVTLYDTETGEEELIPILAIKWETDVKSGESRATFIAERVILEADGLHVAEGSYSPVKFTAESQTFEDWVTEAAKGIAGFVKTVDEAEQESND